MKKSEYGFKSEKLKELIEKNGLKKEFVAKSVGVSRATFGSVLRGEREPSKPVLKLLSIFFKVSESYFSEAA